MLTARWPSASTSSAAAGRKFWMPSNARITLCWAGVRQSPKPGSWPWSLVPPWGSCWGSKDEHGRGKCARAVFAYRFTAPHGVLRLPEYRALRGQEFLLWICGASTAETQCVERGVRLHAAVRRHRRRQHVKPQRSSQQAGGLAEQSPPCFGCTANG